MRLDVLRQAQRSLFLAALLATGLGQSGCSYWYHPWYIVELNARRPMSTNTAPEVTIDKTAPIPHEVRIALLAPDDCEERGAATNSGEATTNRVVAQIDCGEILSDVERAIVERGWPAISWKSIDQAVKSGRATSAIEAAHELGATVMLQINALENSQNSPSSLGSSDFTIRESNYRGEYGPPVSVRAERSDALKNALTPYLASLEPTNRLGAFLDVTAILVDSGRSAWFYKWNHLDSIEESEISTAALFLCHRRILSRCLPQKIKNRSQPETWAPATEKSTIVLGVPNNEQAAYAEAKVLLDEATDDMLGKLSMWLTR